MPACDACRKDDLAALFLARTFRKCRREAFETNARRGFSQIRPTQAYWQAVEEAERGTPGRARGSNDLAGIHG
jgi:hypothetical protein